MVLPVSINLVALNIRITTIKGGQ